MILVGKEITLMITLNNKLDCLLKCDIIVLTIHLSSGKSTVT